MAIDHINITILAPKKLKPQSTSAKIELIVEAGCLKKMVKTIVKDLKELIKIAGLVNQMQKQACSNF